MKKMMISAALVLALSMGAYAEGKDKKERRECPVEQMTKTLNLSEAQAAKLKAANQTFEQEMKTLKEKKSDVRDDERKAMKAAKIRRDSTLKATLTTEQYIQFLEMKIEKLEKRAKHFDRGNAPRMDRDQQRPRMGRDGEAPRRFDKTMEGRRHDMPAPAGMVDMNE